MVTLEQKINLIMEFIVANDAETQYQLKEKIMQALNDKPSTPAVYTMDDIIDDFLNEASMPCHLNGYIYVKTALKMIIIDPTYLDAVNKRLYAQIAEQYDTTYTSVERAIRHAIEKSWDRMPFSAIEQLFGNVGDPGKGRPTNSEFLAFSHKIIARRMRDLE